ncbi:MAG: tape measure protein [Propionibacteriaceae bacterium]|nr:tape measure protein [Propionibacteriaceae bacterium]
MTERNVKVSVRADVADFKRGMDEAARATEKVGTAAEKTSAKAKTGLSGLAQSARDNRDAWSTTGGALTAYGAAVTGLGVVVAKTGIEYNTLRQRSVAALTTLTGSAQAANAQMDKLDDFASNSPFSRSVFIEAQQQLIGFGMEAERVVPTLDAIQNAVAATGGSNQDIAELVRIIAQVGAAGKITATDLMQFGQRGVDAATLIGSQMGMTGAQIREEITKGTLGADEAVAALVAGMDQRFGGAAANVKGTMLGALDRVKAAFRDISASAMSLFVDPTGGGLAVDGLNKLADVLRRFEDLPPGIRNTALGLGALSGVAALGAGSFLMLAPRLVDTWDALSKMGSLGSGAQNAIRNVGSAAKAAAGPLMVGSLILALSDLGQKMMETEVSAGEMENRLRTLGAADGLSQLLAGVADIEDFDAALKSVADDGMWARIDRGVTNTIDGFLHIITLGHDGREEITKFANDALPRLDAALASMAGSSLPDATSAFQRLAAETDGSDASLSNLINSLPSFREHLVGLANEMGVAATDANLLALATGELSPSMQGAADATGRLATNMVELPEGTPTKLDHVREAARSLGETVFETAAKFVDFSRDAANAEVSLDSWLDSLMKQAEARDRWIENMTELARAGLDVGFLTELERLGPDGALRVQQMVDDIAAGRDVSEFNEMGRKAGLTAVEGMVDEYVNATLPVAEIEAEMDLAEARMAHTDFLYGVESTPAVAPMEADDTVARADVVEYVTWLESQTGILTMDADDALAVQRVEDWNAMADAVEGVPTLNADPALAQQELRSWLAAADRATGTSTLDADASRARGATSSWQAWASGLSAIPVVGAALGGAYGAVDNFIWNTNRRSATIPVYARLQGALDAGANLGFGGRRAAGGIERRPMLMGPQYGRTNVILAGEPETRGEAFISNHPAYKRENEQYLRVAAGWFGMDVVKKYAAGAVASRYAAPPPVHSLPVQGRVSDAPVIDYAALAAAVVEGLHVRPLQAVTVVGPRQAAQIVSEGAHANARYGGGAR